MCGKRFLLCLSVNCCTSVLQETAQMQMTVVVREALCVFSVNASAVQVSRFTGVRSAKTKGNDVMAACLTPVIIFEKVSDQKSNNDNYL